MSLPAGPMISLTAALDGVCTIWKAGGGEQKVPVVDFVTGDQRNRLTPGDLLRQIDIPIAALKRRTAFRQISLAPVGRSAALLIGSLDTRRHADADGDRIDRAPDPAVRFPSHRTRARFATRSRSGSPDDCTTPTSTASRSGAST